MKLSCDYVHGNGDQWELLLAENCRQLQTFEMKFSLQYHFYHAPPFIELQQSFSTIFWLIRNVKIEHNEQLSCSIVRFRIDE